MVVGRRSAMVLLGAGAVFAAAGPTAARAACAPAPPPVLIVEAERAAPVRHDDNKTLAELTRLAHVERLGAKPRAHTFGLTRDVIGTDVKVTMKGSRSPAGEGCAWAEEVRVSVGFVERTVHVAREARNDACVHTEVVRHEQRHLALDDALVPEFVVRIRRALADPVGRLAVRSLSSHRTAALLQAEAQRIARELNGIVASLRLGEFRDERHAAEIDTPQEYERFSRACGGAVGTLIRQAQAGTRADSSAPRVSTGAPR